MSKIHEIFHKKAVEQLKDGITLRWERDGKGNLYGWANLKDPGSIEAAASIVSLLNGRVIAITAYFSGNKPVENNLEMAYHFDLDGCTVTVVTVLPSEDPQINSITRILKSADWHEREIQEFYDVKVIDHPNNRPLFLERGTDPEKAGLIPLSQAMDGNRSDALWEKINRADKEGEINE